MVGTMLKSALREIRQSLGRYLAILAIVGLGVGFFSGLRTSQPAMMATGIEYLEEQRLYDFRLLSTLGFTEEDVARFAGEAGVEAARGAVFTDFLTVLDEGAERVVRAHSITEDVNLLSLTAGRMPEAPDECVIDARYFSPDRLDQALTVSGSNDEDTRELLRYDSYTVVGLVNSPSYLNYERGTSSLGGGTIAGFVYIPLEGFDFEAFHEIYLTMTDPAPAYSDAYDKQVDALRPGLEDLVEERAEARYEEIRSDALEEIADAEAEVSDGWDTYHSERDDADEELKEAYQKLMDGEAEYKQALEDYEQGKLDYADGEQKVADGQRELEKAQRELAAAEKKVADAREEAGIGQTELDKAEQDLADARKELNDGWAEYEKAKAESQKELDAAKKKLEDGEREYNEGLTKLQAAERELRDGEAELDSGEASYTQLKQLYDSASQAAGSVSAAMGVSLDAATLVSRLAGGDQALIAAVGQDTANQLVSGWSAAESQLGTSLNSSALAGLRSRLDQSRNELNAGRQELSQSRQKLDQSRAELDQGKKDYETGKAEAEAELDKAYRELTKGESEYEEGLKEFEEGRTEYDSGSAQLDSAQRELAVGRRELERAQRELDSAQQELAEAKEQLDSAPQELADARKELDDGWAEYNGGRSDADTEFVNAETDLKDAEEKLADAKQQLEDLEEPSTFTLTREENVGYACFRNDTSIIEAISVVFPVFFFLVAALVCMTTMKRMVDEQRTQIGILKALGYDNGQIMGKYLFYSGSAALAGSALGYLLGANGLPWIFWEIFAIIYGFAPLKLVFLPGMLVVSFAAALLCSMGATYLSCRVELSRQASDLLRPKAPKAGRRIFLEYLGPLWKHLSFLHKVSLRNVLRYRSRLVMMILGIGGCTALLCTGFGIRDSIKNVAGDQFGEITLYDYAVAFQKEQTAESAADFLEEAGWSASDGLLVHSGSVDVAAEAGSKSVYLVVPAEGSVEGFLSLHSGETPIDYPGAGEVVVNIGLAENLDLHVGDTLELRDSVLGTMEATISAVADNYVYNYVYLSPETYAQQLGELPEYNTLYVLGREDADPYEEGAVLLDREGVSNVTINQATRDQVENMLSRLDYVVVVVVICAGALAFIVLYNLTNINITERIREIATIKVLGFYQNEVASYVFREINMLSLLGSLVGLGMGKALHAYVMEQVQIDSMFFACRIAPLSYAIAFAMTMLFTVAISTGMRPRLRRIDMAESLKSIE